ncbi:GNAT family N-acetyltransferase [Fodinicola feengrottensis]|uniref:Lysine N-acyltransferase MbtK n=1 Tax=Fodinicola feengrottensis TaxID=435914 RepID=A0ABN2IN07_9ACTN|nr:GNAT family N-acetyltransferase [Fodinicola feengrottensis]
MSADDFQLREITEADTDLLVGWMNDPEVDRFWELAGPPERTVAHLATQVALGHTTSYIGEIAGEPMSYWELYRADQDRLGQFYPALPHDGGIHLLLGPATARGRGLAAVLIGAVADRMFAGDAEMSRIVAEPDVRNVRSIRAFERAGFSRTTDIVLPEKRAALMVRER